MIFREATKHDLQAIVAMIADDDLGKTRENFQIPLPAAYVVAFENINRDENQELMVIENKGAREGGRLAPFRGFAVLGDSPRA